jgi:hypothetical protein
MWIFRQDGQRAKRTRVQCRRAVKSLAVKLIHMNVYNAKRRFQR